MLYTHLQPAYSGRIWVRVDGDAAGQEVIAKLRTEFPNTSSDTFACWDSEQFEHYLPSNFSEAATTALAVTDKQRKREAKKVLLLQVVEWIEDDLDRARNALAISAGGLIANLQTIEQLFISRQSSS